jgi:hypothetical protein
VQAGCTRSLGLIREESERRADGDQSEAFTYDGGRVELGETERFRCPVSETSPGDPGPAPSRSSTGQSRTDGVPPGGHHGDELERTEVVREVVHTGLLVGVLENPVAPPGPRPVTSSKAERYRSGSPKSRAD